MTVLPSGLVGINSQNPTFRLQVIGNSNEPDKHIGIGGVAPSIRMFGDTVAPTSTSSIPFARIGLATSATNFVTTSHPGDLVVQTINSNGYKSSILFSNNANNSNGFEQMRLDSNGQLGINTVAPTARLHVNCNPQRGLSDVRFQNLSVRSGRALVVDDNGYVYISERLQGRSAGGGDSNEDLVAAVAALKKQVDYLLMQNEVLRQGITVEQLSDITVFPNPASNKTTIELKSNVKVVSARIQIFDVNGKIVVDNPADFGETQKAEINTSSFIPGTYLVKVFGEQNLIGSKKLIIIR